MRKIIISCLIFLVCGLSAAPTVAEPDSFRVQSLYFTPGTQQWGDPIIWRFSPIDENRIHVSQEGETTPFLRLEYRFGQLVTVEKRFGKNEFQTEAYPDPQVILSEGFPVPFDYLCPDTPEQKDVIFKKHAGGMVFKTHARREVRDLAPGEWDFTSAAGMDFPDEMQTGLPLRMISIMTDTELQVRQIWPQNGSFWIYEETPFRKSWRIP
jgi:hypothetical protein